jgi:gamma-glutamyl:cysteine ligase YbdK (ATP-grasp superfamily)
VKWNFAIALAILAACLGLAGCGSDKESQAEAEQQLCASLNDFAATVVALQGTSFQNSSEGDVKAAVNDVGEAWDQVVQDAKDVRGTSTDTIESAYDDLKQAVEDRPRDKPIGEVVAALESKLAAFARAWTELADGLDCKTTS